MIPFKWYIICLCYVIGSQMNGGGGGGGGLNHLPLLFCKSVYTLIISLLIEKPFYLLSPQSFSFQRQGVSKIC